MAAALLRVFGVLGASPLELANRPDGCCGHASGAAVPCAVKQRVLAAAGGVVFVAEVTQGWAHTIGKQLDAYGDSVAVRQVCNSEGCVPVTRVQQASAGTILPLFDVTGHMHNRAKAMNGHGMWLVTARVLEPPVGKPYCWLCCCLAACG
jgi:hypothetical protein